MIPLLRGIVKSLYSQRGGFKNVNVLRATDLFRSPSSNWDVIYFLDARDWLNDNFILYKSHYKEQRVNGETYK
jgi:hypothetical protein